jgi:integrase
MFRHGLRVLEACALDWSAIDFAQKERTPMNCANIWTPP